MARTVYVRTPTADELKVMELEMVARKVTAREYLAWLESCDPEMLANKQVPGANDLRDLVAGVLFEYDRGGYEAGRFTKALIKLIGMGDSGNRSRLRLVFPDHVKLVEVIEQLGEGAVALEQLLARMLPRS